MAEHNKNENSTNVASTGNWWEGYIIRYTLGSLVGAVICWKLINETSGNHVFQGFLSAKDDIVKYVVLLLMGLCYCYVASSPMLVIHIARYKEFRNLHRNIPWRFVIAISAIWVTLIFLLLFLSGFSFSTISYTAKLNLICGLLVPLLVMLIQIIIIPKGNGEIIDLFKFYDDLSFLRHYTFTDIMTSYRHIREHGNAYAVLMLEVLMGWSLTFCIKVEFYLAIAVLIAWISPGCYAWIVGTNIEKRYIKEHLMAAKRKHGYIMAQRKSVKNQYVPFSKKIIKK
ncbi:hypothetical protein [Aquitalea pelogenes]|uniref:hypothetical protein n=1 Tax=Aquitalea pelogenes TaxID=1293573 RepID=UPI0035B16B1C